MTDSPVGSSSSPIDPTRIRWIKNVVRRDGVWAYVGEDRTARHPEPQNAGEEFLLLLHWPTRLRRNAGGPRVGDLIVLIQDGRVTHLVEVLDGTTGSRPSSHSRPSTEDADYGVFRRVRARVIRGRASAPTYGAALGFTPGVQGGACCRIAGLARFRDSRWPQAGGVTAFQGHLLRVMS